MLDTFLAALSPMLIMFICILIGYILRKSGHAPENTGVVLSKIENYVLIPAQVMITFMTYCTVQSIADNYRFVLYSILCLVVSMLMGVPLSNLFAKGTRNKGVYRYALVFANFGFLGNALVPQLLGAEFLYPYLLFTLPINTLAYTWGINQMIPAQSNKTNPFLRLLNPILIGIVIGAIIGLTGLTSITPAFLLSALNDLSDCMGPVAMILNGFIIGGYNIKELLSNRKVYVMTALRLTVLPAVIIAVIWLFGADLIVMIMALVAFGAALGLNTVVIPASYDQDTKPGASMAMISHVAAVISIPLMYALLTQLTKG